ncbi:NAD+ synthase [Polynucleobacter sp. HIN9]|uniref:NAD+ synthase n=1 Tax=Polynucleobacter sp. HIN9 TaxID=3047868 RepID=UPI0025732FF6|nr:NAD+ synthase [Polynucleobacter sp. HIN9]BEI41422.1 NAD+ synthase [Polynucleobacter sp. HIN9]
MSQRTHSPMQIAMAQLNPLLGDCVGNAQAIFQAAQDAHEHGASLLLTPELSLTGYPPEDLLLRPGFIQETRTVLQSLCEQLQELSGLTVIVGHPCESDAGLRNSASVIQNGKVIATYFKQELPNHEVFDEKRYFVAGENACVFDHHGLKLGVLLCEDIWHSEPARLAKNAGAQMLLVLNASPYHLQKEQTRYELLKEQSQACGLPIVYLNMVGGQDELVFDGGSCAVNSHGELVFAMPQFQEGVGFIELIGGEPQRGEITPALTLEAQVYAALVMGTRDYVHKNRFPGVILGLSGGVDSALVLAIAVDALGAEKVRAVMMPSPYTAEISWLDARELASNLGVQYDEISIQEPVKAFEDALQAQFSNLPSDTTEENIQARVRGTILMALSNKTGRLVLTTGNKSEMAVGYCTLYGDMAGGFAVIKDIAKTLVYQLCRYRNQIKPVIPERILTRPPSAELRPNQTDQDSLPPYEVLDAILARYMEQNQSSAEIIAAGYDSAAVQKITRLIQINEYKRRQAPPGVRITARAFGRDWRYPITSGAKL